MKVTNQEPFEVLEGDGNRKLVDVTVHIPDNRTFDMDYISQVKKNVRDIGNSVLLGGEAISVRHEIIREWQKVFDIFEASILEHGEFKYYSPDPNPKNNFQEVLESVYRMISIEEGDLLDELWDLEEV